MLHKYNPAGWNRGLKVLFLGLPMLLSIFYIGWDKLWDGWILAIDASWWLWLSLLLLAPVNIGLEYLKIKESLTEAKISSSVLNLSYAFFRGLYLRFLLPNKMGLSASIAFSVGLRKSKALIIPFSISNGSQFFVTLFFGVLAFCFSSAEVWSSYVNVSHWEAGVAFVILLSIAVILAYYLRSSRKMVLSGPFLWRCLGYSSGRYLVFFLQFLLAAMYFGSGEFLFV
ncbi:MAG: hypothetical protein ACPF8V_01985 [Luteibaculum sp.]